MQVAIQQLRDKLLYRFVLKVEQVACVVEREAVELFGPGESANTRFLFKQVAVCMTQLLEVPERAQSGQAST